MSDAQWVRRRVSGASDLSACRATIVWDLYAACTLAESHSGSQAGCSTVIVRFQTVLLGPAAENTVCSLIFHVPHGPPEAHVTWSRPKRL